MSYQLGDRVRIIKAWRGDDWPVTAESLIGSVGRVVDIDTPEDETIYTVELDNPAEIQRRGVVRATRNPVGQLATTRHEEARTKMVTGVDSRLQAREQLHADIAERDTGERKHILTDDYHDCWCSTSATAMCEAKIQGKYRQCSRRATSEREGRDVCKTHYERFFVAFMPSRT
jgi:hypothetical protein